VTLHKMRRGGRARGACHGDPYRRRDRRRAVFLYDCIRYWDCDRRREIPHLGLRAGNGGGPQWLAGHVVARRACQLNWGLRFRERYRGMADLVRASKAQKALSPLAKCGTELMFFYGFVSL
jgi:hypothetical protein